METVQLNRQSLGSQIATQVRQDILLGRLEPGAPINQQALCQQYGTSRMPVRDALLRLTHEGLVITRNAHTEVAVLTPDDIADAFLVEAIVHGRAARRAVSHAKREDDIRLRELHEEMVTTFEAGQLDHLVDLNWLFHKHLNMLSGSAKLLGLIRSSSIGIPRDYVLAMPASAEQSNREHAEILEAFSRRDADTVEVLVRRHVEIAGGKLVEYLEGIGVVC